MPSKCAGALRQIAVTGGPAWRGALVAADVRLVGVSGDVVTLDVGGFQVVLRELTDREAVVVVSQGGGDGG